MKKLTAILLVLVLLMPMALGVSAETGKIASFEETFDSYPDGKITNLKMNPAYAWGYSMSRNGSSNIRDKALVLTGTVTYQNKAIPARITACDTYAKEQTWEITVTIPEGLDSEAGIALFRYEGKDTPKNNRNQAIPDNGIHIKDGVLYYTKLLYRDDPAKITTEDAALCKLNPGTYTFKRILNMRDPKHFTYSISLLDASGKEIAQIQDVDCPEFSQITAIYFGTDKANKEVIFDDYKLYASGIITDLTLTDAATGKKLDSAEAQSVDTAYRLAWFNGTDKAKTLILMADIYEDDKVTEKKSLQEITLEPGQEGVETGTVELAEGQSVKFYLRDPAAERAKLIKTILTVAIPLVVVIAIVVAAILVRKKKKNAPQEAPTEENPAEDDPTEETPTE